MLGGIKNGAGSVLQRLYGAPLPVFPRAVLGVILFFAGAELAISIKDIGGKKEDVYVMLVVAGFAMWNMGAGFLVGIILYQAMQRRWLKLRSSRREARHKSDRDHRGGMVACATTSVVGRSRDSECRRAPPRRSLLHSPLWAPG
jgi:hypothetical protein